MFEKNRGLRKVFGRNVHDYDLTSMSVVWLGGRGVEFEARKVGWKHIMGNKPKANEELWLYSPCRGKGLRVFE